MTAMRETPKSPTLRDLYGLVAITAQQVANYGEEMAGLRAELTRLISHQADDIRAHQRDLDRLETRLADVRVQVEAIKAWQMAHQFTCPFVGNGREMARAQIATLLRVHFSSEELNGLAFAIGIDMSNVPGESLDERARGLLAAAERRRLVHDLVIRCQQERPMIAWPLAYD